MNKKKAIKMATECINREIQRLAQQANLYDLYKLDNVHCINASKKRNDLKEVIAFLNTL